jgi:hypothetical protein
MAGRPTTLPVENISKIILKLRDAILSGESVASKGDGIWPILSREITDSCGKPMSAKYIYTAVKDNRHGFLSMLVGKRVTAEAALSVAKKLDDVQCTKSEGTSENNLTYSAEDTTSASSNEEGIQNCMNLVISLSPEEWMTIRPKYKHYTSFDSRRSQLRRREYQMLCANEWANVFNEHFWHVTRLPCAAVTYRASFVRQEG